MGQDWKRSWQLADGSELKSELVEAWGPLAFFVGRDGFRSLPIAALAGEERALVEQFLRENEAGRSTPWADSQSRFWDYFGKRSYQLAAGEIERFEPRADAEPDFYVMLFGSYRDDGSLEFERELSEWYGDVRGRGYGNVAVYYLVQALNKKDLLSDGELWDHVREQQYPFLLVRAEAQRKIPFMRAVQPKRVPAVCVLDRDGNPLFHTYAGSKDLGADSIFPHLDNLLEWSNPTHPEVVDKRFERYLQRVGREKSLGTDFGPKPYHAPIDPTLAQHVEGAEIGLLLTIGVDGKVSAYQTEPALEAAAAEMLDEMLAQWRFIPAMSDGSFVEKKVKLPLRLR